MKNYFGYVRVSTVKQGEHGVSLQEQRDAIRQYAKHNGLTIAEWFEEQETAAKRGRPVFSRMLKLLKGGKARGVIIHKIDRSARNLRDWAELGQLIDGGVEVHFSQESLDLATRGGRLSADIQAVVAADFIRNLREETRKGFYGRLKQGLYPLPAPLGYLDQGKGAPKVPDPKTAPLVRKAFELYATGRHGLHSLQSELRKLGLRNKRGGQLSLSGLSLVLNNPFYAGVIRLQSTGETFAGAHQPLVTTSLFGHVQRVLRGKCTTRSKKHAFLFRRMLSCARCGRRLIGELQKGHVYYRCHTRACPTKSVREERVEAEVKGVLAAVQLTPEEVEELNGLLGEFRRHWASEREAALQAQRLRLAQLQERSDRLTDAYIDRLIDKPLFEKRREALVFEQKALEEHLSASAEASILDQLSDFLELAKSLHSSYISADPATKREILGNATSNLSVDGKNVAVELHSPFLELANRSRVLYGAPYRSIPRTFEVEAACAGTEKDRSDMIACRVHALFAALMNHCSRSGSENKT